MLFRKVDIDRLYKKFVRPDTSQHDKDRKYNESISKKILKVEECYTMDECVAMFRKKRGLLYGIFSRRFVPRLQDGHFRYYSKAAVDRIYKNGNVVQKGKGGER